MATTSVTSVAGMLGAVVFDVESHRLKRGETLMNFIDERHQAGRVLRKGLTVTRLNTPSVI